jgi:hypothetical protein
VCIAAAAVPVTEKRPSLAVEAAVLVALVLQTPEVAAVLPMVHITVAMVAAVLSLSE